MSAADDGRQVALFVDAARIWHAIAARTFGWTPQQFWQLTPTELASALADPFAENASHTAITRADIEQLMERENHG